MTDELLPYYNRELAFLRRMGAEFARNHPKVAGRLRLGPDGVEDPHVARLIESAAFLNARIRHKLDDEFPELTDALLGVLYPHYLAPIPSMAVVKMEPAEDAAECQVVARGAMIETDRVHGDPCRYRTCQETTVAPIIVSGVQLETAPFEAPRTPGARSAAALLRIDLRTPAEGPPLAEVLPDHLRVFLGGQTQEALACYEMLLNDVTEVVLATSPRDRQPVTLGPETIRPVGFDGADAMLPYPRRSPAGLRLLTEYFAFPTRFLFVDFTQIAERLPARTDHELSLYLFLRKASTELQRSLSVDDFVLNCTPVVNLFQKRAEPARLDQRAAEIPVVPDARRPLAMEVYSVDDVSAVDGDGERCRFRPFYGLDHGAQGDAAPRFYHAKRRPAPGGSGDRRDEGSEVTLQLVDTNFDPEAAADAVLTVETTCLNRDLPSRLPYGGGEPRLHLAEGAGSVGAVRCQTAPTPTRRHPPGSGSRWQLISHLSLNHLSLTDADEGTPALKEILRLYDFVGSPANMAIIDSILSVSTRPATMRVTGVDRAAFGRGTDVTIHFDEKRFGGHGLFLFASVLEAFLGLYCSVNSFIRLTVTTNGREGAMHRWPPRTGTGPLL